MTEHRSETIVDLIERLASPWEAPVPGRGTSASLGGLMALSGATVSPGMGFSGSQVSSAPNVFGGQTWTHGQESVVGQPNIFGGTDYVQNGLVVGQTQPNIFGGEDLLSNGSVVAQTQPNIHGGHDLFDGGHVLAQSTPNIFGGVDVHTGGDVIASSQPNIFGGTDFDPSY